MGESVAVTKSQNVPEDAMNFFCFNILLLDSHSRIHWLYRNLMKNGFKGNPCEYLMKGSESCPQTGGC